MILRLQQALPGLALAVLAAMQPWLEQRMATHMLVELPLLFAIGWWAAQRAGDSPRLLKRLDPNGLGSFIFGWITATLWMPPVALDDAVADPAVGMVKVVSVLASGAVARHAFRSARSALQAFFILNWAWMTGAAGLLYQEQPERLCAAYLQGDQIWAGMGLVVLAVAAVATWMLTAFRTTAS